MDSQFDTKQKATDAGLAKARKESSAVGHLQRSALDRGPEAAPPIVHQTLRDPGEPLDGETQAAMGARFQHDFSGVRVHTDRRAAASARAVDAAAYTVGEHVVFDRGRYAPETDAGRGLLAHELAHVVQQDGAAVPDHLPVAPQDGPAEQQAGRAARSADASPGSAEAAVQRQGTTVRSPVLEETVTQASDIVGGVAGRSLGRSERALARSVFGASLDYDRVRLVSSDMLSYRTVGNNIYVPDDFTIRDASSAQTLIHELTHVWQYQHSGTSYISVSLGDQLVAAISEGSRNFAYAYTIEPDQSFFDFNPEQQAGIVEHYFAMLRDRREIPTHQAAGVQRTYASNHLDADGFARRLTAAQRLAEIASELPAHERMIQQMQAALPRTEVDLLQLRATDLMGTPGADILAVPEELQIAPVRPLLEVRFPGL
jgi:hypothetical protein